MKKILYYLLPVVIFTVIFSKIDLDAFKDIWENIDLVYMVLGFAVSVTAILLGAMRWIILSKVASKKEYRKKFLKYYWMGYSIGVLFPAAIGWDFYRVYMAGRLMKHYLRQILIVLFEKFITLLAVIIVPIVLYPWMDIDNYAKTVHGIYLVACWTLLFLFLAVVLMIKVKFPFVQWLIDKIRRLAVKWTTRIHKHIAEGANDIKTNLSQLINKTNTTTAFLFSLAILAAAALEAHLYYEAFDFHVDFLINFFVVAMLVLIVNIPVSFGGLGVKEASAIGLYHLFDVPAEVVLSVSLTVLISMLCKMLIGGLLLLFDEEKFKRLPK
jgi:glycosyltransferase 2 family protein